MKVKSYKKKLLIICLIFSFNLNIFPALISGTLVNTPNGLTSVEKLCVGDNVIGYCTKCKNFVSSPIIKIKKISVKKIYSIKINNEQLFATKFHLFFDPNKNKWIKAKDLTRKNCLMSYSFNKNNVKLSKVRCNNSKKIKKRLIVYEIGLKYPHTYFVSNSNILTHNFAFTLGATVAYGLGTISLESIAIGAAAIGLGICTFFGRKSKHTHVLFNPCNQNHSPNKKPDDEEKKKKNEQKFEITEDSAQHIFRNKKNHLPCDTPKNRKLLFDLTSDMKNFLTEDMHGNKWYGKTLSDGKQLWATVRENLITNGGINKIPRTTNSKTGLSNLFPPK